MKPMMVIGIVLIVLGAVGLVFQGIRYTTREKVVDLPGLEVTAEKQKTVPIPAIGGGLALAGGVLMVMLASKNQRN
jgi:drug/metabolite transporter (DMT)-like permease